jgi:phosphate/sulfate permease
LEHVGVVLGLADEHHAYDQYRHRRRRRNKTVFRRALGSHVRIVTAWILTFPVCGLIGWGTTKLLLMLTAAWP